jgi:hypothetical protein
MPQLRLCSHIGLFPEVGEGLDKGVRERINDISDGVLQVLKAQELGNGHNVLKEYQTRRSVPGCSHQRLI